MGVHAARKSSSHHSKHLLSACGLSGIVKRLGQAKQQCSQPSMHCFGVNAKYGECKIGKTGYSESKYLLEGSGWASEEV